ncbi:cyclase family protein [Geitlerinema sp. P-1104]|uniref:cyclase family protein n=1 Tax=Geitlerinema sp. P-1104 TaxID=2546230 RepID=UPI0014770686|nr:cyclase family protein [Geitlerinema sp. P-1104]NMG59562.1 cyclase family protein [Geitlerinema sp. P-1104]
MTKLIDISVTLKSQMPVWPGSPGFKLIPEWRVEDGMPANVSSMNTDLHIGTHVDAPWHFIQGGKTVEHIDLNVLVGETYVVEFAGVDKITASDLDRSMIPDNVKRLLIKTKNSHLWQNPVFYEEYVALTADAAKWLIERSDIKLVGIDYLSIQRYNDSSLTHEILLGAEVVVIEGLNLVEVSSGMYHLTCLPLKIQGADGAPARAILQSFD